MRKTRRILCFLAAFVMMLSIVSIGAMVSAVESAVSSTNETESTNDNNGSASDLPVASINGVSYSTIEDAFTAAQAGDEIILLADVAEDITVPAGVIFNGNDKQVGAITAAGEITFKGHTKATNFSVMYTGTTINIGEGACLEITGTGRLVIGHGCTFNITGTVADAKTADVASLTPSLIAPGASITGTGVTFNVSDAYLKFTAYCSSKNSNANGTFNINVTNSIWEQSGSLVFSEPTNGKDPTFNFNLKDSVLNSTSHLVFAVSKGEIVFDNSNVNVGTSRQIENRSTMTVKNGSVVNGAVATSSNAKNPGTLIIDNATYAVTGEFSGSDVGTGTIIVKNGASFTAGSVTKANIQIDATDMQAGDEVKITANLSKLAGTVEVINNNALEASISDGKIVLSKKSVAQIGDVKYATLAEAFAALEEGDTLTILAGEHSEGTIKMPAALKNVTIKGEDGAILKDMTVMASDGSNISYEFITFDGIVFDNSNILFPGQRASAVFNNWTITNCEFKNVARGNAAISFNLKASEAMENFTFTNNVINGVTGGNYSGLVLRAAKGNIVISGNNISNVTWNAIQLINTTADTLTITGNTFASSADEGILNLYGVTATTLAIKENKFLVSEGQPGVCYITAADVSENYWGGNAPTNLPAGVTYTSYYADAELTQLITISYVAQIGDVKFATVAAALAYAKEQGIADLVITIIGENTKETPDNFDAIYTAIFDSVTIKQDNGGKTYYFLDIYTGSRTNGGAFVFDGVNIVVTEQYMFEGNVRLTNNSVVKSTAEANCFVYYSELTIDAGSKLYGVIDDFRGGKVVIDGGRTDGAFNDTPDMQDAIMIINWSGDSLTIKNGAYVKVNSANEVGRLTINAGATLTVENSKLDSYQWIEVAGILKVDANSLVTTGKITGAGKIVIDVANIGKNPVTVINADMSAFTGTIEIVNGDAEYETANGVVVTPITYVAQIGDNKYTSLQDAENAAKDGDTIVLLDNITLTGSVTFYNAAGARMITLDMNGKTITIENDYKVFWICDGLTITGNGTFIAAPTYNGGVIDPNDTDWGYVFIVGQRKSGTTDGISGNLVIENGNFYSNDASVISVTNGSVTINDGTFEAAGDLDLNCIDDMYDAGKATITVKGGIFVGFNPENNASEGAKTNFCADGYVALKNLDGMYVVGKKPSATVNDLGGTTLPAGGYGVWDGKNYTQKGDVELPLSFVMQFLADQSAAEAANSPYANWYGDFVITFDGIENGSFVADGCYLAGYYGSFGWVKVPVDGMTITNGVRYPVMLGVGLGQKYDYICSGVQDFQCALYITPEILAENPNLTVNLELSVVDNSKGQEKAAEVLENKDGAYSDFIYEVTEDDYVAGDFVTEVPTLDFMGTSLVLGTNIQMNFYLDTENVYEGTKYYALITISNGESYAVPMDKWQQDATGRWFIPVAGLAAKQMNENISVELYRGVYGTDGAYSVSRQVSDCIKEYAMWTINYDKAATVEMKKLMVTMLNYGAAAQVKFGYDVETLANAGITAEQQATYGSDSVSYTDCYTNTNTGSVAYFAGDSLNLTDKIEINFYYRNLLNVASEDIEIVVSYTDYLGAAKSFTYTGADLESVTEERMKFCFSEIVAADVSTVLTVTLKVDGNVVNIVTDSIESYCAFYKNESPELAEAIVRYASAAEAYFTTK